jgi:hypothetical protein
MSLEAKLIAAAKAATGDDTIHDVAEFEPKGTAGATVAGAVAGGVLGDAAVGGDGWGDAVGQGVGMAGGIAAGQTAVGLSKHLPPHVCVAVSPSEVYLLGMSGFRFKHLDPIAKIDRDKLGVEVHQRVSVRTLVLEDLETGAKFPLEVSRLNFYHGKALVELLMMSPEHHDPELADGEAAPAT